METILFIAYLIFFSLLITRVKFFTDSGIDKKILLGLFILKVAVALVYGWFYNLPQYDGKNDTWQFFYLSKPETQLLLKDPWGFLKDLFSYGYDKSGNLFSGVSSYWNNLKTNAFTKLLAIINVFTGTDYWVDIIWVTFLYFFGPVAFYRIIQKHVKAPKLILIAAVFCLPSFIFWYSGLHKDGLIFSAFCMAVFYFDKMVEEKRFIVSSGVTMLLSLVIVFAFRNYLILLLMPALLVWWLCEKYPSKKILIAVSIYMVCTAIFFISPFINFSLDFPGYVISKQNEFRGLEGNSQIMLPPLRPTFTGFIRFLPYALDISVLRPHINEIDNPAYWPFIGESIFLWGWIAVALFKKWFYPSKISLPASGFIIFCYCFSISLLILSGYTVTLTAAIVRYRSFAFPLIFAPIAGIFSKSEK